MSCLDHDKENLVYYILDRYRTELENLLNKAQIIYLAATPQHTQKNKHTCQHHTHI